MTLAVIICAHNEAQRLPNCLAQLGFADEVIVVLDRCSDDSAAIARAHGAKIIEGAWPLEGDRRNVGLAAAQSDWCLELDCDEIISPALASEIREVIANSSAAFHRLPVDNYIAGKLVRHGWGGSFGVTKVARLSRKGTKYWGAQRVHPAVTFTGVEGKTLVNPLHHDIDSSISDMLHRLDRYTSLRAEDLRQQMAEGKAKRETLPRNLGRIFTRFYKCYVRKQGWREGGWGVLIALCAGLYPLLSYLKATLESP